MYPQKSSTTRTVCFRLCGWICAICLALFSIEKSDCIGAGTMNKHYYCFGNPFKVKFRKHYCFQCNKELSVITHRKVVSQKSDEAQYYDFSFGFHSGVMIGPCEFIHQVFYCQNCDKSIEFITQLSFEDVDIFIKKLKQRFLKKGIELDIKKIYETNEGEFVDRINLIEDIQNLCLSVCKDDKEIGIFKLPLIRMNSWERPYYFKIYKGEIIRSISDLCNATKS